MRKSWGAAVAAAVLITGGGLANADVCIGAGLKRTGLEIATYRWIKDSPEDEKQEPEGLYWFDDSDNKNYNTAFSLRDDRFGASASLKINKNNFTSGGYGVWATFGAFTLRGGILSMGDIVTHLGGVPGPEEHAQSLYKWELGLDGGVGGVLGKNTQTWGRSSDTTWGYDPYNSHYDAYQSCNVGLPLRNSSQKPGLGAEYGFKDFIFKAAIYPEDYGSTGNTQFGWRDVMGLNAQVNYNWKAAATKVSTTVKFTPMTYTGNDTSVPQSMRMSWAAAASTTIVPNWTFALTYTFYGYDLAEKSVASESVDTNGNGKYGETGETDEFSCRYFSHALNVGASTKFGSVSVTWGAQGTLIFLSDLQKAYSNANGLGWRPYVGLDTSLNFSMPANELMSRVWSVSYWNRNMNSSTDGKAETGLGAYYGYSLHPQRGASLDIGINVSYENFSDEAKGFWANLGTKTTSYIYPGTLTVTLPVIFVMNF